MNTKSDLGQKEQLTEKEFLKEYNAREYEAPLMTVDMAIFTIRKDKLHVLLVKRAQHPGIGKWALPGGFIDLVKDKQLVDTARRKLKEKTGIDTPYLEQVETFGSRRRDPRGWSVTVAYFALIASEDIDIASNETSEEIVWAAIEGIPKKYNLAFDHNVLFQACYDRLKAKVQYTSLPINLLPQEFTLSELQKIFEIILGSKIEKKSFRRRIIDANIIGETGNVKTGSNRPAKLYSVNAAGKSHYFPRNIEGPR